MSARTFRFAPMSPLMSGMTIGYGLLTVMFGGIAVFLRPLHTVPMSAIFAVLTAMLVLGAWGVWLYFRPRQFDVSRDGVTIVWPLRQLSIPRATITDVRIVPTRDAFRAEFGWGMRVGVGGLWGVFGYLATGNRGKVDIFASKLEPWVLIERRGERPMIITPEDPEAFVRASRPAGA